MSEGGNIYEFYLETSLVLIVIQIYNPKQENYIIAIKSVHLMYRLGKKGVKNRTISS
jgi:hypothetical protein